MNTLRTSLALFLIAFGITPAWAALFEVTVNSNNFSPSDRTIDQGDQIRWEWGGTLSHTTTHVPSPGDPVLWDQPITSSSQTYTHTFNSAGVFNYKCTPHGFTGRITVNPVSGILDDEGDVNGSGVPAAGALHQNAPNPFNAATQIEYALDRDGAVELVVYNILGQEITTLVRDFQSGGIHWATWDGRDDRGRETPSGIYFARLQTSAGAMTRKMVLLR